MGRCVSHPSGAVVAYRDVSEMDEFDWRDFTDWLTETACEAWPSLEPASGWRGREDRILASNRLADFGVSEYDGIAAVWIAPRDNLESPELADSWLRRIAPRFHRLFGQLERVGRFSNGGAVYRLISGPPPF